MQINRQDQTPYFTEGDHGHRANLDVTGLELLCYGSKFQSCFTAARFMRLLASLHAPFVDTLQIQVFGILQIQVLCRLQIQVFCRLQIQVFADCRYKSFANCRHKWFADCRYKCFFICRKSAMPIADIRLTTADKLSRLQIQMLRQLQ
jgi:hypothetical protein